MKITRLSIKNYRGIKTLDVAVPPSGAIVTGKNAKGKTSVLRAIQAALAAQGIDASDIRIGSDKSEIMIDIDALKVRRSITPKSSTLKVLTADGDQKAKPQTLLNDLLGPAAFDPLNFFLAKPEERRKLVLDCMPVEVMPEDLEKWGVDDISRAGISVDGHGLEVIERLYRVFYERRTEANRNAKEASAKAEAAETEADRLTSEAGPNPPTLEEAQRAHTPNIQTYQALKARADGAAAARAATEKTRARIAELREQHQAKADATPKGPSIEDVEKAEREMMAAEEAAEAARQLALCARSTYVNLKAENERYVRTAHAFLDEAHQIEELEASIADVDAMAVAPEDLAAAEAAGKATYLGIQRAKKAQEAAAAAVAATHVRADADAAKAKAERLHGIVEALTNDAPADVANRGEMIEGLAFDGDRILLDGVPLDSLCGMEQMEFAVKLARRANAKSKILVVDGLERLDPEQFERFCDLALADDWQLLGTRVSGTELQFVAIEREAAA